MSRFRLRFLLQEIDLPQGETLIGRSATCQVTLDDPLVSREHARIRIHGKSAVLEDLGSRNGVQLGGKPITGASSLKTGDRIRIGTQELVFLELPATAEQAGSGVTRQTGFMCHCAACARAYPAELVACPVCGERDRVEEDTLTGNSPRDWGLELAAEAVGRALALGATDDLERVLSHARLGLEQKLAEGLPVERRWVDVVGLAAGEIACARGEATWARWALSIFASLGFAPPSALSERLRALPAAELASLAPAAGRALESSGGSQAAGEAENREALRRLLEGAGP